MRTLLAPIFALVLASSQPASAQESRAELLTAQRAEKAARLEPYKPSKLEKLALNAEEGKLRRMISPHNGFYAQYGYSYKVTGSGIGFSGGFRHDLFNRQARVDLEVGATFRRYSMIRADFALPRLFDEHLEVGAEVFSQHHPQEDFYGLGASREEDRVSYLYRGNEVRGRAIVRPRDWLDIGARVGYLNPSVGGGRDSRYPSIQERFDDSTAPGLVEQPTFIVSDVFAEIDYRDERGYPRDGGRYVLTLRRHADRDLDRYSFSTTNLLLQQFFPIFDKKRVFAFQFAMVGTDAASGSVVPFYLQPTVGGGNSVRSVDDYRYRDNAVAWLNAEYRWEAFSPLTMALFTDWGTFGPRLSDLTDGPVTRAYGIGFRLNTAKAVFVRFDIATGGGEGTHFIFKYSKVF